MYMESESNAVSNGTTSAEAPSFRIVDDGTQGEPRASAPPPVNDAPDGETKEERTRRLKADRDRRYRERKSGAAVGGPGAPPPPGSASGRSPVQDAINDLKGQFAAAPGISTGAPPPTATGPAFVATGELLLGLCNGVLPEAVARFKSKNRATPIDPDRVRLKETQLKALKPSAAATEAYVIQYMHPAAIFGLSLLGAILANVPPPTPEDIAFAERKKAEKANARTKR